MIWTFNKVTTESLLLGRNIKNKSVLFVKWDLDIKQWKCGKWLTRTAGYYLLAMYERQKNISLCTTRFLTTSKSNEVTVEVPEFVTCQHRYSKHRKCSAKNCVVVAKILFRRDRNKGSIKKLGRPLQLYLKTKQYSTSEIRIEYISHCDHKYRQKVQHRIQGICLSWFNVKQLTLASYE